MTTQQSVAEIFLEFSANFEKKTHEQEEFAHNIAQKTKRVIRFSVTFLTVFAIFTAFAIYSLAMVLEETVTHMETMYQNFGTVTEEMSIMTSSVTSMEHSVSDIRPIAEVVSSMRKSIAGMEQDMVRMDQEIIRFNQDIQQIQQDTEAMSVIFDQVNQNVGRIRYDVSEISRTSKFVPIP